MRRSRKPKVVWLPPASDLRTGNNPAELPTDAGSFSFQTDITGAPIATGDTFTSLIDVVGDLHTAPFQQGNLALTSLADIESSGYRLRRIVGKIFIRMGQSPAGDTGTGSILVTAGFIVLRTDSAGNPVQASSPEAYNALSIENWADPWIWRRTWALSNFVDALLIGNGSAFPENNINTGSALDGPHVDAKTARVVGPEERLFLVISTVALDGAGTFYSTRVDGELRCLASMRQNMGNRRNASR